MTNDKNNPVKILSADDILSAEDLGIVEVHVPEWGGIIYVKAMSAFERERYIQSMRKVVGTGKDATVQVIMQHSSAKLAALTICDANGNLLFDRKPDTIEALGKKSAKAMERVVNAAAKLNGLDDDKNDTAEDKAKNDSAGQPEDAEGLSID